ncbi:MAG: hypothetical protein L3J84_13135 [Gammaproteobacteria bacterium]|nr:hypothetical protein [Gammaproteobacteria bacterium]
MNNIQNDRDAKTKAKNALVLNKIKPIAISRSTTEVSNNTQPIQKTRG